MLTHAMQGKNINSQEVGHCEWMRGPMLGVATSGSPGASQLLLLLCDIVVMIQVEARKSASVSVATWHHVHKRKPRSGRQNRTELSTRSTTTSATLLTKEEEDREGLVTRFALYSN